MPAIEAQRAGRLHSLGRDRAAIQHHYDVSNDFYRLLLGPSMVYSCAYFDHPDESLEAAQERKLELICRKLRLAPGERLLDIGCGWGSLLIHAAEHHGVRGVGVTLSPSQAQLARERIEAAGLSDRIEIRVSDYREITDGPFDKIASVGMYEHVGHAELEAYARTLHALLRPGGLFLNHGIARLHSEPPPPDTFLTRYVFPDGELHPVADAMAAMQDAGLEIRDVESLREHYPLTLRSWLANLDAHRDGGGRRDRQRPRAGLAAVHARLGARLRSRRHHRLPAARHPARRPARPAAAALPAAARARLRTRPHPPHPRSLHGQRLSVAFVRLVSVVVAVAHGRGELDLHAAAAGSARGAWPRSARPSRSRPCPAARCSSCCRACGRGCRRPSACP